MLPRSLPSIALLALITSTLPGCIAWEIRDEVHATNEHLADVKPALIHTLNAVEETNRQVATTNARVAETNTHVTETNALVTATNTAIAQTQAQLATLQADLQKTDAHLATTIAALAETNPKLGNVDGGLERMRILQEVHASLKEVNSALGPLSKAMGSLGGAMSFLGLSSSDASKDLLADEEKQAAEAAAAKPSEPATSTPATAVEPTPAAGSNRPDPILGTWVLVYPPPAPPHTGRVMIITADGKFLTTEDGKPPLSGRWTRQGRTMTFTPDAAPGAAAAQPAETVQLLTLNSHTLTVRNGDTIRVHTRP